MTQQPLLKDLAPGKQPSKGPRRGNNFTVRIRPDEDRALRELMRLARKTQKGRYLLDTALVTAPAMRELLKDARDYFDAKSTSSWDFDRRAAVLARIDKVLGKKPRGEES